MARFASLNDAFMALADIDPSAVDDARDIVAGITGHRGIDDPSVLSLADMLRWLWLRLPTQPGLDPTARAAVVQSASTLFALLERPAWVGHCRSDTTAKVHAAWDRSPDHGMKAFRKAFSASGVEAPDVDDFQWGTWFGPDEQRACDLVELVLERAIGEGNIVPGRRGWKQEAARVTSAVLEMEARHGFGQRWIDLIVTERLGQWVDAGDAATPTLSRLRGRIVNQLLHPVPVPTDAAAALRPLTWLCVRIDASGDKGLKLTSRGYLERAVVEEAADELGWRLPGRAVRSEADLRRLSTLRFLAMESGLIDIFDGRLITTVDGVAVGSDVGHVWRAVVQYAGQRRTFDGAALHAVLLVVLGDEGHTSWRGVSALAAEALGELGWTSGRTGQACTEDDVMAATAEWRRMLDILGVFSYGDVFTGGIELTSFGRSLALAILRVQAAGARRDTNA